MAESDALLYAGIVFDQNLKAEPKSPIRGIYCVDRTLPCQSEGHSGRGDIALQVGSALLAGVPVVNLAGGVSPIGGDRIFRVQRAPVSSTKAVQLVEKQPFELLLDPCVNDEPFCPLPGSSLSFPTAEELAEVRECTVEEAQNWLNEIQLPIVGLAARALTQRAGVSTLARRAQGQICVEEPQEWCADMPNYPCPTETVCYDEAEGESAQPTLASIEYATPPMTVVPSDEVWPYGDYYYFRGDGQIYYKTDIDRKNPIPVKPEFYDKNAGIVSASQLGDTCDAFWIDESTGSVWAKQGTATVTKYGDEFALWCEPGIMIKDYAFCDPVKASILLANTYKSLPSEYSGKTTNELFNLLEDPLERIDLLNSLMNASSREVFKMIDAYNNKLEGEPMPVVGITFQPGDPLFSGYSQTDVSIAVNPAVLGEYSRASLRPETASTVVLLVPSGMVSEERVESAFRAVISTHTGMCVNNDHPPKVDMQDPAFFARVLSDGKVNIPNDAYIQYSTSLDTSGAQSIMHKTPKSGDVYTKPEDRILVAVAPDYKALVPPSIAIFDGQLVVGLASGGFYFLKDIIQRGFSSQPATPPVRPTEDPIGKTELGGGR